MSQGTCPWCLTSPPRRHTDTGGVIAEESCCPSSPGVTLPLRAQVSEAKDAPMTTNATVAGASEWFCQRC
jgi:hypothetical protein